MTTTAEKTRLIREYTDLFDAGERRTAERWLFSNTTSVDTIALHDDFDHILCTETDIDRYQDAQFRVFDQSNIAILYGPFSTWASLLKTIAEPCTFWITDSETLLDEAELIFQSFRAHVILVEGTSQQDELDILLEDYMRRGYPESNVSVEDDVIRISPLLGE